MKTAEQCISIEFILGYEQKIVFLCGYLNAVEYLLEFIWYDSYDPSIIAPCLKH